MVNRTDRRLYSRWGEGGLGPRRASGRLVMKAVTSNGSSIRRNWKTNDAENSERERQDIQVW
jgi:hypothetical protein